MQCRDILAQEYLLEVITQVFPDDFHLQTLDLFLSATGKLNPGVNVKNIVISMIDRLAAYANREAESQSPEIRKEREEAQMKKLTAAVRRIRFRGDLAEEYGLFKDHTIEEPEETSVEAEAVASVAPPMPVLDGGWGDSTTATDESDATEATTAETADSEVDSEAEHADTEETPATEEDVPDDSSSDGGLFGKDDDDDPIREFAPNAAAGRKAIIVDKPIVESRDLLEEIRLFEVFFEQIQLLIKARPDLPIGDVTALLVSLTNLCLNCYPAELEYIDQIMGFTLEKCEEYKDNADLHSPPAKNNILALLLAPISSYKSLLNVLAIPNYLHLLHAQSYATRRSIAAAVAHSILKNYTKLEAPEDVEGVAELLRVVIKEGQQPAVPFSSTSAPTGQLNGGAAPAKRKDAETEETVEEQGWLARMVHLIESDIPDVQFRMLQLAKKAFSEGGDRIKYTFPALVTSSVKLVQTYWGKRFVDNAYAQKIVATFKFSHQLITEMYAAGTSADTCLRLYIFCGQIADQVESEEVAFEFFAQAYIVFEEALTDSRAQFQALSIIAGALHSTRNFTKESYETLITKNALFGSKLLKKPDQCRAVYFASHLWWAVEIPVRGEEEGKTPLYRDGKRVLECLQRALRVADACMDSAVSIELFVEILNRYVYYFDRGCEVVTVKYVNGLISLIMSNLSSTIDASVTDSPRKHFERTLQYINAQKEEDERFDQITW